MRVDLKKFRQKQEAIALNETFSEEAPAEKISKVAQDKPNNVPVGTKARKRVLDHLLKGNTLTRVTGWETLGLLDIAPRIMELKNLGYNIQGGYMPILNCFGEEKKIKTFWIDKEDRQAYLNSLTKE